MAYYIYKHYNSDNEVIYVGQTKDMNNRQYTHRNSSHWRSEIHKIEYSKVYDKYMMDIMEKYYISKYKPKYNLSFNDCSYYEYFNVKKELEFKEYKESKSIRKEPHLKTLLLSCSSLKKEDYKEKYKEINVKNLELFRYNINKAINDGKFYNLENKNFSMTKDIENLYSNYKVKLMKLGMNYINRSAINHDGKAHKFIYNFEDLKLIYENCICLEHNNGCYNYLSFTNLINNKLAKKFNPVSNFKVIYKTSVSNIKSKVPIHNTEYISFIEEQEGHYLGFIYGMCFKIDKKYIIDKSLIEKVESKPIENNVDVFDYFI